MANNQRRERFQSPSREHRPLYYFTMPEVGDPDYEKKLKQSLADCLSCGAVLAIPKLPDKSHLDGDGLMTVRKYYEIILKEAERLDLRIGFFLDPSFEHAVVRLLGDVGDVHLRAQLLDYKEYLCKEEEHIERRLHDSAPLAVVAVNEEYHDTVDLRPYLKDGVLTYQVPRGSWTIREYFVTDEQEKDSANYLSYDASYAYICAVFSLFANTFEPYMGNTLSMLVYSGIGFNGINRRNWDRSFNRVFEECYGFDPSPYYPALFGHIGKDTRHIKALLMSVRASLLQNGIIKALRDFAERFGLEIFGCLSEPKMTACSWLMGDAMLNNLYSPCALFDKAYLYGTNSVKIAAGAAYCFDRDCVSAELFRNYANIDTVRIYKDSMNAFARGVNRAALHIPPQLDDPTAYCTFVSRVQTMLRGGRHVADIAMLYPIYDLHSRVNLYHSPVGEGYEYPATVSTADYMGVINAISLYAGHDLTVLHPTVLQDRCHTENGILYLDNKQNREQFRVVVMPCADMISIDSLRLLKEFYDGGGKILATGELPTLAFEYDRTGENDREVRRLTEEIFGADACDKSIMKRYCHNKNERGGEAIYLYFNASAVDGARMTKSSTINQALNSFEIPFDIYIPGMQRFEVTGALNASFPEYRTIGLHATFPGGGMISHIHKRDDDGDVYYFTNTTNVEYNHHVLLRGAHEVEKWDPHTGEITPHKHRFFRYRGEVYTNLRLTLPEGASVFFRTTPADTASEDMVEIESIHNLQSEHAALMSEF
ncbi:MAG: hypothetical protein E7663_03090 [Ruminococcaceae bacterium]|nr:hypothetical protein [Oscillospiraceae bacterium]